LNGKAQPGREFVIKHLFSKLRHCDWNFCIKWVLHFYRKKNFSFRYDFELYMYQFGF